MEVVADSSNTDEALQADLLNVAEEMMKKIKLKDELIQIIQNSNAALRDRASQ